MRVIIDKNESEKIFRDISPIIIARKCKVSSRTIYSWKNLESTIPLNLFRIILRISGIKINKVKHRIVNNYWNNSSAGVLGGRARCMLYGNPGTAIGRKKGGVNSIITNRREKTDFKILKLIKIPKKSEKLSEFLGILAGDGHLSDYQVLMVTNSETDMLHARFVSQLGKELFGIEGNIRVKKYSKAVEVVFSSKTMVDYLEKIGLTKYDKIKNNAKIPIWVKQNKKYSQAYIRGLFDTDGCIYLDRHCIDGKNYYHLGWALTSYNSNFITDTQDILNNLKFFPTNTNKQKSVYLRRQSDIRRYFDIIGTSNSKHQKRFDKFGRVPKRS